MKFNNLIRNLFIKTLIISIFLFTGCSSHETPVEKANREKVLIIGNSADPASLDPHFATTVPEYKILIALFEGLTSFHPETLEPIPGVAESWKVSEDGLTYTFFLRKDARWSHGQPVYAEDFEFSYKRILNKILGSPNAAQFFIFKNAESYFQGDIEKFEEVGIKALDHHTLELTLENPTPYLISLLSTPPFFPVHQATIIKHHALDKRHSTWTRPGNLVSNGPFMLLSYPTQGTTEVVANANYWNSKLVELRKIQFVPITNPQAEEVAFRAGQIHITDSLPVNLISKYKEANSPYLQSSSLLGLDYYAFNTLRPPFDNPKVREAFNLALNRKMLTQAVLRNSKVPAYNFVPPHLMNYEPSYKIEEDDQKARKLLAEAGYPNGKDFPNIEILFNTSENNKIIAEAIQGMLAERLNIHPTLENQEYKVYLTNRSQKNFIIARSSWVGDYLDPSTFLNVFTSTSGNNYTGFANKEYDELVTKANQTTNTQERYKYYQEAEKILMTELPIMPLFFYQDTYLVQTNVEGWYANILDFHPYQYVRLK